jgi:hypothetical protein
VDGGLSFSNRDASSSGVGEILRRFLLCDDPSSHPQSHWKTSFPTLALSHEKKPRCVRGGRVQSVRLLGTGYAIVHRRKWFYVLRTVVIKKKRDFLVRRCGYARGLYVCIIHTVRLSYQVHSIRRTLCMY